MVKLALLLVLYLTPTSIAATRVRAYSTRQGEYRAQHFRSTQNKTQPDNYSTQGNINPFTGKQGTKAPNWSRK